MDHDFAAGRCEFGFWPHAQDFGIVGIGDDQTGIVGQKLGRKVLINGSEVTVTPFQIALPLVVGLKVGAAGFALDDPNLAFRAKRHHVNP